MKELEQLVKNINEDNINEIDELIKLIETQDIPHEYHLKLNQYKKQLIEYKKAMLFQNKKQSSKKVNTIDILTHSLNTLQETENVGTNILNNLDSQSETINNSIKSAKQTNDNTKFASKLTTKMSSWWR